ncbi:UDP-2,3-diacylglucosamine diphosphatase [Methylomonas sp. DH-1]|uniref:UDP-2,3-diacylglucosamine diphosphatase n=1 Tax=Methylomonas sp. (strain DH-1) TaxID=1727196 RepID=UPI0007C8E8F9|nr:UDP-2,3-diacylglucosamine diphosphatase [Methylomonas sp. DH-1]ANE56283.1 UDP-2,3-diacylglucosamine hydrolase [Methylomonas sp. DH-1]
MKDILFISDLHLTLEKPEILRRFFHFLRQRASKAQALYILGDLFDAWIGDDDNTRPARDIKRELKQLTASGVKVFIQQGNRDFLLGNAFCTDTGVSLLGDFAVIELDGQRVLLTHGDLLCSDDIAYQAFRIKSRSREWQDAVLRKPVWLRLIAARWYRLRSYFHKREKSYDIMDVNQDTVIAAMREYDCRILVHGHTHRPGFHEFMLDGLPAKRYVLADWRPESAGLLCWKNGSFIEENIEAKNPAARR